MISCYANSSSPTCSLPVDVSQAFSAIFHVAWKYVWHQRGQIWHIKYAVTLQIYQMKYQLYNSSEHIAFKSIVIIQISGHEIIRLYYNIRSTYYVSCALLEGSKFQSSLFSSKWHFGVTLLCVYTFDVVTAILVRHSRDEVRYAFVAGCIYNYTEHCSVWSYQFYRYDRHYYYYYGADEDFRF